MSAIYAWLLPEATSTTIHNKFVQPVNDLPLVVSRSTISCHACFNFSQASSTGIHNINLREIFECFKFVLYFSCTLQV